MLTAPMPVLRRSEWQREVARNPRLVDVKSVPATVFCDIMERQAQQNHGQSLVGLAGRGGLSPQEMLAVLACSEWRPYGGLSDEAAHRLLYAVVSIHNRGMRVAERAAATP